MNILYTASTARHICDFHIDILSGLKAAGFDITVACRDADRVPPELGAVEMTFSKRFLAPDNIRAWRKLRNLLKCGQFDVISTHTALAGFVTRMALFGMRRKRPFCIHTAHGYLFGRNAAPSGRLTFPFEKLCSPVTDMIMTMNNEDYSYAHKLMKRDGRVVMTRGAGVDAGRFGPAKQGEKERMRKILGLPEGFLIFCAAEFSARKNHKALIRAMPAVLREIPAYLLLAGDGALREKIYRLAGRLGVLERIRFLGYVRDTSPYLKACDMAVSASLSEGMPIGIQEALATGLPVAASRVKGHIELLENGAGALFDPCSALDISRCCVELAGNIQNKPGGHNIISRREASEEILRYYLTLKDLTCL